MNDKKLSLAQVAQRRILRVVFGRALLFSSVCFIIFFIYAFFKIESAALEQLSFAAAFVGVWGLPLICVGAAKVWLSLRWRSHSAAANVMPSMAFSDEKSRVQAQKYSRQSLALPLFAIPLLLPLSLHYCVSVIIGAADGFYVWLGLSMVIVGHAHLALSFFGLYHSGRMVKDRELYKSKGIGRSPGILAWALAILVAAIPGVIFYGLPPFIVGLSGFFIPLMYKHVDQAWEAEEAVLG